MKMLANMGVWWFASLNNMLSKFFVIVLLLCSCFGARVTQSSLKKWCYDAPGLNNAQIQMCRNAKGLRPAIKMGLDKTVKMCQSEFRNNPWNCQMLGKQSLLQRAPEGTKEAAFVMALTAAALALQISNACEQESLIPCSCEFSKNYPGQAADPIRWRKCRAKITHAAAEFTVAFLSLTSDSSSPISQVDHHNIKVGLKVFRQIDLSQCIANRNPKHGKCSLNVTPLKTIVNTIKRKYFNAKRVTSINNTPRNTSSFFHLKQDDGHSAKKTDLVFLNQSPDYCERDEYAGIPGTQGRPCNARSLSEDGCAAICCGRGHYMYSYVQTLPCQCEFTKCKQKKCKSRGSFEMVCKQCSTQLHEARCN